MPLPISMEDLELFPKNKKLSLPDKSSAVQFLPNEFEQVEKTEIFSAIFAKFLNYFKKKLYAIF